jgi:hypothetical protein
MKLHILLCSSLVLLSSLISAYPVGDDRKNQVEIPLSTQLEASLTPAMRQQAAGQAVGFALRQAPMSEASKEKVPAEALPALEGNRGSHSVYGVAQLDQKGKIVDSQAYHLTLDKTQNKPEVGPDGRQIWQGHPTQSNEGFGKYPVPKFMTVEPVGLLHDEFNSADRTEKLRKLGKSQYCSFELIN